MGKNRKLKKQSGRWLGVFTVPSGGAYTGELTLRGSKTRLTMHSDGGMAAVDDSACIFGKAYSGESLTLIDCLGLGSRHSMGGSHSVDVYPHYVVIGRRHVEPSQPRISAVHFSSSDLTELFFDLDAFGSVFDASAIIDSVLKHREPNRAIKVGKSPIVYYYTDRSRIAEVRTVLGLVLVEHWPSNTMGGPMGFWLKDKVVVSLVPEQPISFQESMGRARDLAVFLSVAAGRTQALDSISVSLHDVADDYPVVLDVYPAFRWLRAKSYKLFKPDSGVVPLNAIERPNEFAHVLSSWIASNSTRRVARTRLVACMGKANRYDVDRLVAAANMFDILPDNAFPSAGGLPEELAAARDKCVDLFRPLGESIERDSVLSALGRIGRSSLPKRVLHRAAIVQSALGDRFEGLEFVLRLAIKMRNYFVHGGSDGFEFERVEPFVSFFTNALEFVFAASELIEAGWDARSWNGKAIGDGHMFGRFREEFGPSLLELRRAIKPGD